MLLDFIADVCPSPKSEYAIDSNGEPVELTADENGPWPPLCFLCLPWAETFLVIVSL